MRYLFGKVPQHCFGLTVLTVVPHPLASCFPAYDADQVTTILGPQTFAKLRAKSSQKGMTNYPLIDLHAHPEGECAFGVQWQRDKDMPPAYFSVMVNNTGVSCNGVMCSINVAERYVGQRLHDNIQALLQKNPPPTLRVEREAASSGVVIHIESPSQESPLSRGRADSAPQLPDCVDAIEGYYQVTDLDIRNFCVMRAHLSASWDLYQDVIAGIPEYYITRIQESPPTLHEIFSDMYLEAQD